MGKQVLTPRVSEEMLKAFDAGICYDVYNNLGAHVTEQDGVSGVYFAVWAPRAVSVSVVGAFNHWDTQSCPMRKVGDSGVYELFVAGLHAGTLYKYAVKQEDGETVLKADPYAAYSEVRPRNASVVWNVDEYEWNDAGWLAERSSKNARKDPLSIYEVHLGSWMRKEPETDEVGSIVEGSEFYNYRELAEKLAGYVENMGYTHVELLPVMEHPLDASGGFQITGYYAPTSRFGTPEDFQYFVDYLHSHNIGVIIDWVPSHFPKDQVGLARFDGTCVYEHLDPRQGENPRWGTLLFNYGRPQVSNFLIANALYWADKFHVDGLCVSSMAIMLYLDYDKRPGQWIPNLYGGNENLEAIEFLKHLASIFHKSTKGAILIAEESEMWGKVTGDLKEGALGLDYKWNLGWSTDFQRYMFVKPTERSRYYGQMTYSMLYAYSEDFIVGFTHDDVTKEKGSLLNRMPGDTAAERLANLRAAYGYWMTHPGKKMLFMGQDMGQDSGWSEREGPAWENETAVCRQLQSYVRTLNGLYRSQPALHELDFHPDGFEWIDCLSGQENMIAFLRRGNCVQETLLVVCNFAPTVHKDYQVGVPLPGWWQEILSSDAVSFGGGGMENRQPVSAGTTEHDGRMYSVKIDVAPYGIHVFKWKEK